MPTNVNTPLSTLTGARQTLGSWSRRIESPADLPEAFRRACQPVWETLPVFPYCVFAPVLVGAPRKTTEKLLCLTEEKLYVWERAGNDARLHAQPLETIIDLEVGEILLYSWLTFHGRTETGAVATMTIEFNTASRRHYAPVLEKLRPAARPVTAEAQRAEQAKFQYLATENFKFMNYACASLLPGEKVLASAWQPQIRKPLLKLGRWQWTRTLALAQLTLVTDQEFILIQDDAQVREQRGARYGGKWRYIPWRNVREVALTPAADPDLRVLALTLAGGVRLEVVFAAAREAAAQAVQAAIARQLPAGLAIPRGLP